MDIDDDEIGGRQAMSFGRSALTRQDPFAAGAAKVLKRGNDLLSVTVDERSRFRLAFFDTFATLPEKHFANLLETIRPLYPEEAPGDAYAPEDVCCA